jgi:hypothetical protein
MMIFCDRFRVVGYPGICTSTVTGNVFLKPITTPGPSASYTTVQLPVALQDRLVGCQISSIVGNPVTPTTVEPTGSPVRALRLKLIGFPP